MDESRRGRVPEDRLTDGALLIREATLADAEGIVHILNPIIESGRFSALDTVVTVEEERRFIEHFPVRGVLLVAVFESSGSVVGFQDVEPFGSYTRAFDHVGVIGTFVDLTRRREGIGRRLFTAMFEAVRQKGYEKLFGYVRQDNDAALAAYLSQGFQVVGIARRHAKIDGRYIDEVLIEKFL